MRTAHASPRAWILALLVLAAVALLPAWLVGSAALGAAAGLWAALRSGASRTAGATW